MGGVTYFVLSLVIEEEMDHKLKSSLEKIKYDIDRYDHFYTLEPFTNIDRVKEQKTYLHYSDTKIKINRSNDTEDFRQLTTVVKINKKYYKIIIRESKLESRNFLKSLALITFIGFIVLIASLILINRRIAKIIWAPFYRNIDIVKKFSITDREPVALAKTDIHEFHELNMVLSELTEKVRNDYRNLKQFSEDASHEIQTPLAIIKSKIETLLDDNNFNDKQGEVLDSIYRSIHRLSRLNKDLILLTKIENKQFGNPEKINLKEVIENKLEEFQELIQLKGITLSTNLDHEIFLNLNAVEAEMLINNLISNAIKHNINKGIFKIILGQDHIAFYNSGFAPIKNPESIFNRFYKENAGSNSVGLGLAIVKKICDNNQIRYHYYFTDNLHCFTIHFKL
jgi:hypothetical protein